MATLYKMFSFQGGLNWIYGECAVRMFSCQGGLIWLDMDMKHNPTTKVFFVKFFCSNFTTCLLPLRFVRLNFAA